MKITTKNMEFLGKNEREKRYDLCLHGDISLEVNGKTMANEEARTLSAAALRFLRAAFGNHFYGAEEHMMPCCGHEMYASEDGKTVHIFGCPYGFDFDVLHENGELIFRFENGNTEVVLFTEYRSAVLAFTEEVEAFYRESPPRETDGFADFEKDGFFAFWCEFSFLKERLQNTFSVQPDFRLQLDDYTEIDAGHFINVVRSGINFGNFDFVHFRECAYHYQKLHGGDGALIGECDVSCENPFIMFYTSPKPLRVRFHDKTKLNEIQNQIFDFGYIIKEATICNEKKL